MQNHYQVLGVPPTAQLPQIQKAYWRLSREWHPDKNHTKEAKERFQEISQAFELLEDPVKRKAYDDQLKHSQTENLSTAIEMVIDNHLNKLAE